MKKLHILILATILALALTACGMGRPYSYADAMHYSSGRYYSQRHHGCHNRGPHYHW